MYSCCSASANAVATPPPAPPASPSETLRCVLHLTAPVDAMLATCESLALPRLDTLSLSEVWDALFRTPQADTLIAALQWQQLHCTYWALLGKQCFRTHGENVRAPLDAIYAWRTDQQRGPWGEAAAAVPTDDQWARMYLWVVQDIPLLLQHEWRRP
jgi:hypothetical protein